MALVLPELLDHVERLGVTKVITLGALLTDTPHTRPTPVSGTSYDTASAARCDVEPSTYQGPTGIVGVFQNACVEAGIPAFSFWASVPHYVSQARVPKAAVALLHRVEEVLDVEVPLGALPEQAEEWERTVSRDGRGRRRGARVRPAARGAGRGDATAPPRPTATTIAADFERYLRRRGAGRPGQLIPRRLAVAGLYAGAFIGPFGGGVTVAMLPELGASYGVSSGDVAVSVTAYLLPFAALQVVSGTLGRAVGRAADGARRLRRATRRRRCSARWRRRSRCSSAARALQGAANAFTTPLLFAALASSVAPERLGRALGWFGSLQAAGQTSAPLIGGVAAEVDWRWAFAVSALVSALLAVVGIPGSRTSAPTSRPGLRTAWRRDVLRVGVVAAVGWGCVSGLSFLVALRLEDVFALSAGARGLVLTGLGVAGLATARLVGSGADRIGPRRSVLLGAAAGIVVLVGVGLAPTVGLVAAAWALGGVATQLVLVGVNLLVLRSSPVNRGGSMSLVQAIRFGGGSLAPVVFTPLYGVATGGRVPAGGGRGRGR